MKLNVSSFDSMRDFTARIDDVAIEQTSFPRGDAEKEVKRLRLTLTKENGYAIRLSYTISSYQESNFYKFLEALAKLGITFKDVETEEEAVAQFRAKLIGKAFRWRPTPFEVNIRGTIRSGEITLPVDIAKSFQQRESSNKEASEEVGAEVPVETAVPDDAAPTDAEVVQEQPAEGEKPKSEDLVLKALAEGPKTVTELVAATKLKHSDVAEVLKNLKASKKIVQEGVKYRVA
jgi:hypothetical protein